MKSGFYYRMMIGFIAVILFILVIAFISVYYTNRVAGSARWVEHTITVLNEAEHTLTLANDMEKGANGFTLTKHKNYLAYFTTRKDSIYKHLQILKELTKDNPSQQIRIDSLSTLVKKRIEYFSQIIELEKQADIDTGQMPGPDQERVLNNQISKLLSSIQKEENRLLILRQKVNEQG